MRPCGTSDGQARAGSLGTAFSSPEAHMASDPCVSPLLRHLLMPAVVICALRSLCQASKTIQAQEPLHRHCEPWNAHMHMRVHTRSFSHMYTHACTHAHLHVHTLTPTCIRAHTMHTLSHACVCILPHMYVHTHAYSHMHTKCSDTHIHTCTHTHPAWSALCGGLITLSNYEVHFQHLGVTKVTLWLSRWGSPHPQ